MLSIYPAIFYKEKDGSFSVIFPDLNHLATDGRDFNEAMTMAVDCLAGYIYSEKKDGKSIPAPTPIEEVKIISEGNELDDYETAFVNAVTVDVEIYAKNFFDSDEMKTAV